MPETRKGLSRLAATTLHWAAFGRHWDELRAALKPECPAWRASTCGHAPKTPRKILGVIREAEDEIKTWSPDKQARSEQKELTE
ncbi:hypothetical protein [Thioalkalivibrio sp. K90mix]|uniref:hypothetical protein n=1 Tax=Thioalkalivibrio sp. (strain K90mix) TaxID=396595 RepID=UPI0003AB319F|nr:hypothetical protein [Thioalkalivibrio sp. K90mix]